MTLIMFLVLGQRPLGAFNISQVMTVWIFFQIILFERSLILIDKSRAKGPLNMVV